VKYFTVLTPLILSAASAASASDFETNARSFLTDEITKWATHSILIDAVRDQNTRTSAYKASEIDALDQSWRQDVGDVSSKVITPILNNAAAEFLREQAAASNGTRTEILLMDSVGLNVAVSHVTSDFWQGDEAKFTQTYSVGADAVPICDIEFDDSSQSDQSQLSFTPTDPANGAGLGAMTVGVNAEALM